MNEFWLWVLRPIGELIGIIAAGFGVLFVYAIVYAIVKFLRR